MRRGTGFLRIGLILLTLLITDSGKVFAISPSDQLKETINRIIGVLQDRNGAVEIDRSKHREGLRQVLSRRFDFKEMAKMSLGAHWNRRPESQQEFVAVFSDFVESSYLIKMESLSNTKIIYVREQVDRALAQVDTRIVPSKGDEIPILYKLRLVGSEWKIYDVLIDNISLVENYRSQFNRILASATFDDLIKILQQKVPAKGG